MEQGRKFKGKKIGLGPSDGEVDIEFKRFGPSTNPGSDQLRDMNTDANWGTKNIELGWLGIQNLEKTPQHYYDEMRRLSKLTGTKLSMHAPIMNLAGLKGQEREYSETERQTEERILKDFIDNSHKVFGSKRGIINVHGSDAMLSKMSYLPDNGKREEFEEVKMFVDPEHGKILPVTRTRKYSEGRVIELTPDESIKKVQGEVAEKHIDSLVEIQINKSRLKSRLEEIERLKLRELAERGKAEEMLEKDTSKLGASYREVVKEGDMLMSNLRRLEELEYEKEQELKRISTEYNPHVKKRGGSIKQYVDDVTKKHNSIDDYIRKRAEKRYADLKGNSILFTQNVENDVKYLKSRFKNYGFLYPDEDLDRYKNAVDYEREKASETLKNAALYSYKKYGKKAPMISVENPFPWVPFGRPSDLASLVEKTREKLAKDLVKKRKMNEGEAKKVAKEMVGVTWDTGHINMLKKYGFKDEDILKEFNELNKKGIVKHVHITDNFGYEDSHLVPGWGNAPIKKYLEELEKKGYKGDFVLEAGGVEIMMDESKDPSLHPFQPSMQYMAPNIYSAMPQGERWTDFTDEFNRMYSSNLPGTQRDSIYQGYTAGMYGSFSNVPAVFGSYDSKKKDGFLGSDIA